MNASHVSQNVVFATQLLSAVFTPKFLALMKTSDVFRQFLASRVSSRTLGAAEGGRFMGADVRREILLGSKVKAALGTVVNLWKRR